MAFKYFYGRIKDLTCQNTSKIWYFQVNFSMKKCEHSLIRQLLVTPGMRPNAHC